MFQLRFNKETNSAKIKNLISNTPESLSRMVESIIFSKWKGDVGFPGLSLFNFLIPDYSSTRAHLFVTSGMGSA